MDETEIENIAQLACFSTNYEVHLFLVLDQNKSIIKILLIVPPYYRFSALTTHGKIFSECLVCYYGVHIKNNPANEVTPSHF